jgi:hypothetical protein
MLLIRGPIGPYGLLEEKNNEKEKRRKEEKNYIYYRWPTIKDRMNYTEASEESSKGLSKSPDKIT